MAQVNPDMSLQLDKMSFDSYCTKDGKWIQLLGVDYLKHVPLFFKCFDITGQGWMSVAKELLTTPSVLKDPMQIVPLVFNNVSKSIRKEMNARNWSELKILFDEKKMWYTHIAVPNQGTPFVIL